MIKAKVAFLKGRLLTNQSNLKTIENDPIRYKKAGPPKNPLLF